MTYERFLALASGLATERPGPALCNAPPDSLHSRRQNESSRMNLCSIIFSICAHTGGTGGRDGTRGRQPSELGTAVIAETVGEAVECRARFRDTDRGSQHTQPWLPSPDENGAPGASNTITQPKRLSGKAGVGLFRDNGAPLGPLRQGHL